MTPPRAGSFCLAGAPRHPDWRAGEPQSACSVASAGGRAASRCWRCAPGLQWRQPRHREQPCGSSRPCSGVATWAGSGQARTFRCCQTWGCGAGLVAPAMAAEEEAAVRGEVAGGRPQVGAQGPTLRRRLWRSCGASSWRSVARWEHFAGGSPLARHRLGLASEPRSFLGAQVRRSARPVLPGSGGGA